MPVERSPAPGSLVRFRCLPDVLSDHAKRIADAPAILAPGRTPLTYARLYQHIVATRCALRARGIGRHDRVAVALPNGSDAAVAILGVMASAACVPINPAYAGEEASDYLAALRPRALIAPAGLDGAVVHAARLRNIDIIALASAADAEAGRFSLASDGCTRRSAPDEPVDGDDVALLLPTSGTTRRPRIVPMTQANLCASAYSSLAAVALTQGDRCINVMPLFHGHGLTNVLLASLAAGASVVCASGCDADHFLDWVADFRPTWYSAVPAMHQAILAEMRKTTGAAADTRLRFIRSASAPLPPHLLAELERAFATCVIEAYGMTETASCPIASNPLPPRRRKAGSVGVPVGLDVAIMDDHGVLRTAGETGEIVVRGASVMVGYDGDPSATRSAFAGGWFKTGDLGFFDGDGYLFITGRIREMINRGGQKIAPQEIDDVLLEHQAVAEAVTFAVPHASLGEDVGCAIVLRPNCTAAPTDIRQFAVGRMSEFKVPRQILIVEHIPKGPTGKVQRIGLAAKLGLTVGPAASASLVAPRTPLERALAKSWREILRLEQIGIHDDFFASGGDSLLACRALSDLYELAGAEVDLSGFFAASTIAEVARRLEAPTDAARSPQCPPRIHPAPRENGVMPASIGQERMWMLQRALPELPLFNVVHTLRLKEPCAVAVLDRSLNEIVRRHEMLRTSFAVRDDRLVQVIAPELTARVKFDDLHSLRRSGVQAAVRKIIRDELLHRYDLSRGPLVRMRVVRLNERKDLLLIGMAGIIQDGWSLGVFVEELATLYDAFAAGRASPLTSLPIQYADFANWQRRWRSYPDIVAQLAYWREQLRDPPPIIKLGRTGAKRARGGLATARRKVALAARLSTATKRFSRQEGVTLFMTLVAAFKILLHRYTGEDNLRVATHVANRNRPHTEGLIGPLVNTVILRTSLSGKPNSREVLFRVRATTVAALANQDIPFEEVVGALKSDRKVEALAQVMIWLQNEALRPIMVSRSGITLEEVDPDMLLPLVTVTTFDVILMLRESPRGLVGTCVYNPHLFGAGAIDRLLRDFEQVLEQIVMEPERPISAIHMSQVKN